MATVTMEVEVDKNRKREEEIDLTENNEAKKKKSSDDSDSSILYTDDSDDENKVDTLNMHAITPHLDKTKCAWRLLNPSVANGAVPFTTRVLK